MITKLHILFFVATYVTSMPVFSSDMNAEIEHLLSYVENTECLYERNGTMHKGKDAVEHIKKKYNYFKDKIDSTEKFIELSATKSTMSGKYYMILCKDKLPVKSQEWLLRELESYRTKNSNTTLNFCPGNAACPSAS